MCLCAPHVCSDHVDLKRELDPLKLNLQFWNNMCVLETKPQPSARAASVPNLLAISQTPNFFFDMLEIFCIIFIMVSLFANMKTWKKQGLNTYHILGIVLDAGDDPECRECMNHSVSASDLFST